MSSIHIIPQYKLLLSYDIRPEVYDVYYPYVINEFVPALQEMGLYMLGVWHVAYGDYPMRQLEFVTEDLQTVHRAFQTERWQALEEKLKTYTDHYDRKVVKFRQGFQI